jgi:hypothetical protein
VTSIHIAGCLMEATFVLLSPLWTSRFDEKLQSSQEVKTPICGMHPVAMQSIQYLVYHSNASLAALQNFCSTRDTAELEGHPNNDNGVLKSALKRGSSSKSLHTKRCTLVLYHLQTSGSDLCIAMRLTAHFGARFTFAMRRESHRLRCFAESGSAKRSE